MAGKSKIEPVDETEVNPVEKVVASDDQGRADRFTWGPGDVVWTAIPNGRGAIIELGDTVRFAEGEGVVKQFGDNGLVSIEGPGGAVYVVKLADVEPA